MKVWSGNDSLWIFIGVFIILSGISSIFMGRSNSAIIVFGTNVSFWAGIGFVLFGILYFIYYTHIDEEKPFR